MPSGSSGTRERQYEHVKKGAEQHGSGEGRAEEIDARTVNKERARTGEARWASRSSTRDISERRGGGRPTRDQMYAEAQRRGVEGRSSLNTAQLRQALSQ